MSEIRTNLLKSERGDASPSAPFGLRVSGVTTTGTLNVTANATIDGNLGVAGTLTYEDVTRVDAVGLSTFREGFGVGPLAGIALTAYKDGSIRTTGIVTATTVSVGGSITAGNKFYGDGSQLTGISAGGGKILQVVQEHRTDVWSESNIAPGAKTGAALTKAITTTANNNKVLVTISLTIGWSDQAGRSGCLLKRGGTEIALGDSTGDNKTRLLSSMEINSGHWCEPLAFTYLDSPGSAATHTYTVHLWNGHTADTLIAYLNRAGYETNHSWRSRGTSSITLMEVSP